MTHTRETVLARLRETPGRSLQDKVNALGPYAQRAYCDTLAGGSVFDVGAGTGRKLWEGELDAIVAALNAGEPEAKPDVPCPGCNGRGETFRDTTDRVRCDVCGGKGRLPPAAGAFRATETCRHRCERPRGTRGMLICTLAAGHDGDHVGHSGSGYALGSWPREEPDASPAPPERDWRIPPPFKECAVRNSGIGEHKCSYIREHVPVQWRGVEGQGETQGDAYADFCARLRKGYRSERPDGSPCPHDGGKLPSARGTSVSVCALCGATGLAYAEPSPPVVNVQNGSAWTGDDVIAVLQAHAERGGTQAVSDACRVLFGTVGEAVQAAWASSERSPKVPIQGWRCWSFSRPEVDAMAAALNKAGVPFTRVTRTPELRPSVLPGLGRAFASAPAPKPDPYVAWRIDRLKTAGGLPSAETVEAATAACRDRLAVVRSSAEGARKTVAHYEAQERAIVAALAECGAKEGGSS